VRTVLPAGALGIPVFAKRNEAYHLDMGSIHPECLDSDPFDPLVVADILLRQEPGDEDEEEDDGSEEDDDDDDDGDDGYSE
jgi:hypothetical protein